MTYGELKARIAYNRLNRPDLLNPIPPSPVAVIPDFVLDRIGYSQKSMFSPSEQLDYSLTCIPGQSIYPFLAQSGNDFLYPNLRGIQNIVHVRLLLGSTWIPMRRMDWYEDILANDVLQPAFRTLPYYWATYGQRLRIYPTPDRPYPLELMANLSPPAPVEDTDTNFWTEEQNGAASLIIASTCAEICREFLNDVPRADRFEAIAKRESDSLRDYSMRLRGPVFVRSWL